MSSKFGPDVRLRSRPQFTAVQDRGRRVSTRSMTLLGLPNSGDRDRLGIIASRKLGGAVVRNRAKRRIRDIFRRLDREAAGVSAGNIRFLDFVAIPRRELLALPMAAIEADFATAVRRLRGSK